MDFEALLGQIENTRPDLADSLSLIRQFQKEKKDSSNNGAETGNGKVEEVISLLEKQKRINRNLLQQYDKLEDNYKLLIEHLDLLAEALGACPQCWGEDIQCKYCRGKGKPGYYLPNQEYFDTYIKPVINKINNNKS